MIFWIGDEKIINIFQVRVGYFLRARSLKNMSEINNFVFFFSATALGHKKSFERVAKPKFRCEKAILENEKTSQNCLETSEKIKKTIRILYTYFCSLQLLK